MQFNMFGSDVKWFINSWILKVEKGYSGTCRGYWNYFDQESDYDWTYNAVSSTAVNKFFTEGEHSFLFEFLRSISNMIQKSDVIVSGVTCLLLINILFI